MCKNYNLQLIICYSVIAKIMVGILQNHTNGINFAIARGKAEQNDGIPDRELFLPCHDIMIHRTVLPGRADTTAGLSAKSAERGAAMNNLHLYLGCETADCEAGAVKGITNAEKLKSRRSERGFRPIQNAQRWLLTKCRLREASKIYSTLDHAVNTHLP